tara:strand:+ start:1436 stop:1558 length:123 start_codon:yes stop_codon:yes gene_type:complete
MNELINYFSAGTPAVFLVTTLFVLAIVLTSKKDKNNNHKQ